jgi:hypothetical protein
VGITAGSTRASRGLSIRGRDDIVSRVCDRASGAHRT